MIFDELNKLKQQSIMMSISLIVAGIFMIICPEKYTAMVIGALGSVMLVFSVLGILEYFSAKKALIQYVYLTGWLAVGIVGAAILFFEIHSLYMVCFLFGVFLIISGLSNAANAFIYARRTGRGNWWVLVVLSAVQVLMGLIILANPWWRTYASLFTAVGVMLLFSSLVSIVRLIWLWPIKSE